MGVMEVIVTSKARSGTEAAPKGAVLTQLKRLYDSTGDLLATGTPEGVGIAMTPPTFLQPGDVVRCEVARIGTIENRVIHAVS